MRSSSMMVVFRLLNAFRPVKWLRDLLPLDVIRRFSHISPSSSRRSVPDQWSVRSGLFSLLTVIALGGCSGVDHRTSSINGTAPVLGPADAPVEIVEFGDYECGPCSRLGRRLHEVIGEHTGRIRLIYRQCPSRMHPVGQQAARVAAAAAELGEFWRLHWILVEEGPIRRLEELWPHVEEAGLSEDEIREIVISGRPDHAVQRDLGLADQLAVRGMPTTFINGRRLEGAVSLDQLREVVEEVLVSRGLTPQGSGPHTGPPNQDDKER